MIVQMPVFCLGVFGNCFYFHFFLRIPCWYLSPANLEEKCDRSGIRTHASEDTAALTQRLWPLGHPASMIVQMPIFVSRWLGICFSFFLSIPCCYLSPANLEKKLDRSAIRTHASEDTAALTQRLRPLGHPASMIVQMPVFCLGVLGNCFYFHFFLSIPCWYLSPANLEKKCDTSGIRTHA